MRNSRRPSSISMLHPNTPLMESAMTSRCIPSICQRSRWESKTARKLSLQPPVSFLTPLITIHLFPPKIGRSLTNSSIRWTLKACHQLPPRAINWHQMLRCHLQIWWKLLTSPTDGCTWARSQLHHARWVFFIRWWIACCQSHQSIWTSTRSINISTTKLSTPWSTKLPPTDTRLWQMPRTRQWTLLETGERLRRSTSITWPTWELTSTHRPPVTTKPQPLSLPSCSLSQSSWPLCSHSSPSSSTDNLPRRHPWRAVLLNLPSIPKENSMNEYTSKILLLNKYNWRSLFQ